MNRRWVTFALWLLPVAIGLLFRATTSGHGDGPVYRIHIGELLENGILPVFPLEYSHPGHFLMVLPVYGLGKMVGWWQQALPAIQLVSFLMIGWAANAVFCTWLRLRAQDGLGVAAVAGLALATLPGVHWHSQEAMSDVTGHALALVVICRLLRHYQDDEHRPWVYCVTGFLAGWSGLVRVSSGLFLPMFAALTLRIVLRHGVRAPRWWPLILVIAGGLLPFLVIYANLVLVHGWTPFWGLHLTFSADNTTASPPLSKLLEVAEIWLKNVYLGLGPGVVLAAVGCVFLAIRQRSFLWLGLLLLPYLAGVFNNRAAFEFRYMLPVMMFLSLGYAAIAIPVQRRLGARGVGVFLAGIVLFNIVYAWPVLHMTRTQEADVEVGARIAVDRGGEGAALVGMQSYPFLLMLAKESQRAFQVRASADKDALNHYMESWPGMRAKALHYLLRGRRVVCISMPGVGDWRQWMRRSGFREEVLFEIPRARLRPQYDWALTTFGREWYAARPPLQVLALQKPELPRIEHREIEDPPGMQIEVYAPGFGGQEYRLLLTARPGSTEITGRAGVRDLVAPLDIRDPHVSKSWSLGDRPIEGVKGLRGRLDSAGRATAFVESKWLPQLAELFLVLGFFEDASKFESGCFFTEPRLLR